MVLRWDTGRLGTGLVVLRWDTGKVRTGLVVLRWDTGKARDRFGGIEMGYG